MENEMGLERFDGHTSGIFCDITDEIIAEIPKSTDGETCALSWRVTLIGDEGEEVDSISESRAFYFEIVLGFGDESLEHGFAVDIELKDGYYDGNLLREKLRSLKESVGIFLSQLEGKCHREYLAALAAERYLLREGEEERPPFDYKRFFIGASVVSATLILMLIVINDILPRLL